MAASLSHRPAYTASQLKRYFERIALPASVQAQLLSLFQHRDSPSSASSSSAFEQQLSLLTTLQQHQLAHVQFENLSLHYSPHRTLSLDVGDLYGKIVERRRGGYCMENNCFFRAVLHGLGFTVCSAGARISHSVSGAGGGGYLGWSHMVNIVTLFNGKKYMVDVGFGAGPTRPLPLAAGDIWPGLGQQQQRLVHENIAPNTDSGQRLWIYQSRKSETDEWMDTYCFTEMEFLPADYEIMNFYTSQSPKSWFTQQVVVVKFEMENEELIGIVTMVGGEVKRIRADQTETLKFCKTEGERLTAFKTWFGIELEENDVRGIKDLVSELKG